MRELRRFLAELRGRRVFRVAVVYATVTLPFADLLWEPLGLPSWTMGWFIVVAAAGFPIALVLAWPFEITPKGMHRTEDPEDAGTAPGRRWSPIVGVLEGSARRSRDRLRVTVQLVDVPSGHSLWAWERGERVFLRAVEPDSSYSTAHQWYANHLTAMARFDAAETAMRRAMELDPLSMIAPATPRWVFYYASEQELAQLQLERTIPLDPGFESADLWLDRSRGGDLRDLADSGLSRPPNASLVPGSSPASLHLRVRTHCPYDADSWRTRQYDGPRRTVWASVLCWRE